VNEPFPQFKLGGGRGGGENGNFVWKRYISNYNLVLVSSQWLSAQRAPHFLPFLCFYIIGEKAVTLLSYTAFSLVNRQVVNHIVP